MHPREGSMRRVRRRVLCAVDLTARSHPALRRAMSLARRMDAEVTVLHAVDPHLGARETRARVNRAYVRLLSMVDQTCGQEAGLIDVAVRSGEPLELIARAAHERAVDLVVIAAPQPRPLDNLLGATAERLIRKCRRPLLIVRQPAQHGYGHVAIATDLSRGSLQMIERVNALGVLDEARTTVLHASEAPYVNVMEAVGLDDEQLARYRLQWREEVGARLQAMLHRAGVQLDRTQVTVHAQLPWQTIQSVLAQAQPDLLAIGASRWFMLKRLLVGSVADRVLREVACDVLVIPHRYDPGKTTPLRRSSSAGATTYSEQAPAA